MKLKVLFYLAFALILQGCASTAEVIFDYNLDIDFDNYDTYVLCVEDLSVENDLYPNHDNTTTREYIANAIESEMQLRGHKTNVLNPQLQVGFRLIIVEEDVSFKSCTFSEELEYWENCKVEHATYLKETLILYASDYNTNKIIWQASIECDMNKSKKKLESYVYETVALLFDTYPKYGDGYSQ